MRPGQTLENYLADLGAELGIGLRSMWAAWRNEYLSARSEVKLENLAKEKARNNADKAAARDDFDFRIKLKTWADDLEKYDPFMPREHVAALREAVAILDRIADLRGRVDGSLGRGDTHEARKEGDE